MWQFTNQEGLDEMVERAGKLYIIIEFSVQVLGT